MSRNSLIFRLLNFTQVPLVTPNLLALGARAIGLIPVLIFFYHSINYYADYLQAQSLQFYDPNQVEVFDFIVVGGGSAGAVVANRLSKHSRVLLLELGGDPNPLSYIPAAAGALQRCASTDLMYETVPQNNSCNAHHNNVAYWPRGTGIGGSSNLNFMIYQRGNPADYDNWANITGNPDWSYDNVLSFFKKLEDYHGAYPSETYHGKGGPVHVEKVRQTYMESYFLEAARDKGFPVHDTNGRQGQGFGEMDVTHYRGLRWSTYPAYIEPILRRKNLRIYRYARVVKIHLDKKRHAYGLTYLRHGMKKFVRAQREIIISAGAVDTPKLLLLSGIGPKPHLNSVGLKCRVSLNGVGQNLQDHLFSLIGPFTFNEGVNGSLMAARDVNLDALIKYTSNQTGPIASISTLSAVGHISTSGNPEKSWPDIQLTLAAAGTEPGFTTVIDKILNVKAEILERYVGPYHGKDANFVLLTLVRPKSTGDVRLKGRNPFLKPLIQPNYFLYEQDVKAMVDGAEFTVDMYENTRTYRGLGAKFARNKLPGCEEHEWKSAAYFACYVKAITLTLYHPVGTAAMGRRPSPSSATGTSPVVDPELRVFKTRGLRVIDASIMPKIVNSNTNIPSILIGEVGSFLVRRYWASQLEVSLPRHDPAFSGGGPFQCFYSIMV